MQVAAVDHTLTERWAQAVFKHLHDPIDRLIVTVLISLAEPHGTVQVSFQRLAYLCHQAATFTVTITARRVAATINQLRAAGLLDGTYDGNLQLTDPRHFPTAPAVAQPHRPSPYERQVTAATFARARGCRRHAFDSGWWVKSGETVRWTCSACRT